MEYRVYGDACYVRLDRGDDILASMERVCELIGARSAVFTGIGACSEAVILTFDPGKGAFGERTLTGMLELVSLNGNVICGGDGRLSPHAHAAFAYRKPDGTHAVAAGHVARAVTLYTAEIELRPVKGGVIGRKLDPVTGTGFWDFTKGEDRDG